MYIQPLIPKDKKTIRGYGKEYFMINEQKISSSIILSPNKVIEWSGDTEDLIDALTELDISEKTILLVGTGEKRVPDKILLEYGQKNPNLSVEFMDTGAACRTYNVLLAEDRNILTALKKL